MECHSIFYANVWNNSAILPKSKFNEEQENSTENFNNKPVADWKNCCFDWCQTDRENDIDKTAFSGLRIHLN